MRDPIASSRPVESMQGEGTYDSQTDPSRCDPGNGRGARTRSGQGWWARVPWSRPSASRLRGVEHNAYNMDFWNLAFWFREG